MMKAVWSWRPPLLALETLSPANAGSRSSWRLYRTLTGCGYHTSACIRRLIDAQAQVDADTRASPPLFQQHGRASTYAEPTPRLNLDLRSQFNNSVRWQTEISSRTRSVA